MSSPTMEKSIPGSINHMRSKVLEISQISNLVFRRNKNQHRRSHWWRHFNSFRRQLQAIDAELETWAISSATSTSHGAGNIPKIADFPDKLQQRVHAWCDIYVVKWYSAFSQVLAEKRFVSIGLVLLALLAKACAALGVSERLMELGEEDDGRTVGDLSEIDMTFADEYAIGKTTSTGMGEDNDLGVLIERDQSLETDSDAAASMSEVAHEEIKQHSTLDTKTRSSKPRKPRESRIPRDSKKKKRKPTGNAIDDLFDALS